MTTLPLLPPGRLLASDETGHNDEVMIAYGAACAAAERERCAKMCEAEYRFGLDDERAYNGMLMAAAIRRQA